MTRKWLPDNVTQYRDRHGKARYRFRKTGLPTYHFRNAPGSEEFRQEYQAALNAEPPAPKPRHEPGTVNAVYYALRQTPKWRAMKPSSKRTYESILDRFCARNGERQIKAITTARIDRKLAEMESTPAAANNLRKGLSRLFKQAIKMNLMKHNPAEFTDSYATGPGFYTWSEDDLAAYDAKWAIGTRERLAKELLLYTALRKSDMVNVGPHNRKGDRLILGHAKNESETSIPIAAPLMQALEPFDNTDGPYLQTQFGKAFTGNGFGNWFRTRCDQAGLPQCTAHGLRKAMSRRLAESGATNQQGRSITGHKTDKEFTRYAEKANKSMMADDAMANLEKKFANSDKKKA